MPGKRKELQPVKNETDRLIPIIASDLAGQEQAPEWVQVLPVGLVKSTKGNFNVDSESVNLIINWFKQRGNDMVIDYEHQTLDGVQAPASGWVKELADRGPEGLWARVEWTPKAQEYIENKEYRYFSPVVAVRPSDRKAVFLHSIGLTNLPAISGMKPIANKDIYEEDEGMEIHKQLASALSLDESASEEQVLAAVKALKDAPAVAPVHKEVLDLLDLKDGASLAEIKGRVIALKNPAGYVKAEEFKALSDKLALRDRDELVSLALSSGKISPAQKAWAAEYALKDPTGFAAFIEAAPQVVPLKDLTGGNPKPRDLVPDETQLSINKMLGVDAKTFKEFGGEADGSAQ